MIIVCATRAQTNCLDLLRENAKTRTERTELMDTTLDSGNGHSKPKNDDGLLSDVFNKQVVGFVAAHAVVMIGIHLAFPGAGAAIDGLFASFHGAEEAITSAAGEGATSSVEQLASMEA